jgi:U3 small nucleolar ribonucleoprotein protein LCP5
MSSGLSLLLLRPHLLLTSLHQLVLLLAFRLTSSTELSAPTANNSTALRIPYSSSSRPARPTETDDLEDELAGELVLCQEIMEKVKGLESKVAYQVKKLVALAEAEEAKPKNGEDGDEDLEEG